MPAIRDSQWAATAVATGTTLVIPMPESALNDLLVAVIMADTTGGTWTSAGWTHVTGSPAVNTSQLIVMWKLAIAVEATTYTFTGTTAESYNGAIISIRDVDTTSPFGSTPIVNFTNQAAAAKFNMQTVTTNVDNSLVLYASANSGLGVPSLLEGPVFGLIAADGIAESLGIGWGFMPSAGVTPADVGVSNVATGAGVKVVLQIAPPAAGATVIPAYCAADSCVYIDPLNGVTAYNGNTAIAATADTGFGTTLGGKTAGDAGVTAAGDVGLNSFHSCARLTSITGSQTLSGAQLVFGAANRPDVTGKNILVHLGPSTEGQLQRFSSISSGRGIWFGMRSGAATDYKIWQSYGAELGSLRHQPVVINSSAGSTVASAGTLDPAIPLAFGFWVSGTGTLRTIWDFASIWLLDTTTICGGNAALPVSVEGVVASSAIGKERKSVVRQGASQALAYQPIQFGNGGTNPIYLDLDATAFEFPSQYNSDTKQVTYNSIDNVVGITYYAGASDTIKHRNSVVSSPSDYHWRIHASSSASATYSFDGLALIGAGDVVLKAVTTFSGMSFVNCTTVAQNSAVITSCVFNNTFMLSNLPSAISSCAFTSSGTGHALEITAAGTYTFSGNSFIGYSGTSTNAAIYNNSGGLITLNITAGGTTPSIRNGAGASTVVNNTVVLTLTGLVASSDIVIKTSDTSVALVNIDQNPTGDYGYSYTYAAGTYVDIKVIKAGYIPYQVYDYLLSSSNSSLPIAQVTDRNYV